MGGAAGAYYFAGPGGSVRLIGHDGCDAPDLDGRVITAEPVVETHDGGRRRVVMYTLDAARFEGGALDLCIDVGDIVLETSAGAAVELVFDISSDDADAVTATVVEAAFAEDGTALAIGAWEAIRGESAGMMGTETASVDLTLRLPATGAYDARVSTDVGNVRSSDMLLGTTHVSTDVGDIDLAEVDLTKDVTLTAEVGNVQLAARSVQSGTLDLAADVGDIDAKLPARAEVGYDATASSDVGSATIRIGATESHESEAEGPSEHETARSTGYAEKVTRVVVRAITDVGDTSIIAE